MDNHPHVLGWPPYLILEREDISLLSILKEHNIIDSGSDKIILIFQIIIRHN